MDNWGTEETKKKKNSDIVTKILIVMMVLLLIIIIAIVFLLYNIKLNTFRVAIDGKTISETTNLQKTIDDTTYINIEKLANLLGYDYHSGEYKGYSSSGTDKCYIQSSIETASFYLNSNKICKLKVDALTEDYDVFTSERTIIQEDNAFYAPLDAIQVGFNVQIQMSANKMNITTLNTLVSNMNAQINGTDEEKATYKSLLEESFENQKALLYNYVIIAKKDSNLYGVLTKTGNELKELLPDKYSQITFLESTKEFLVTNSLGKMGIIDQNGQNIIEQEYDSIKVIDSNPKLYLVEMAKKYGVVNEEGVIVVYPEYDSIGVDTAKYKDIQNQYVLFNSIIPVCKEKKYGLFDIDGNKVLDVQYDGIGCELESVEVNGVTKAINPTVTVENCEGIVIKNGTAYDLFLLNNAKTQPISLKVSSVYYVTDRGEKIYYMIYKGEELNLIERLIRANIIQEPTRSNEDNNENNNTTQNTIENSANNTNLNENIITNSSTYQNSIQ